MIDVAVYEYKVFDARRKLFDRMDILCEKILKKTASICNLLISKWNKSNIIWVARRCLGGRNFFNCGYAKWTNTFIELKKCEETTLDGTSLSDNGNRLIWSDMMTHWCFVFNAFLWLCLYNKQTTNILEHTVDCLHSMGNRHNIFLPRSSHSPCRGY